MNLHLAWPTLSFDLHAVARIERRRVGGFRSNVRQNPALRRFDDEAMPEHVGNGSGCLDIGMMRHVYSPSLKIIVAIVPRRQARTAVLGVVQRMTYGGLVDTVARSTLLALRAFHGRAIELGHGGLRGADAPGFDDFAERGRHQRSGDRKRLADSE